MANKNIEMKRLNGQGEYDSLYPKTLSTNVIVSDETAIETGLSSGATVDEALKAKPNDGFEIGDIILSVNKQENEKWKKCNQQILLKSSHPELNIPLPSDFYKIFSNNEYCQGSLLCTNNKFYYCYRIATTKGTKLYIYSSSGLSTSLQQLEFEEDINSASSNYEIGSFSIDNTPYFLTYVNNYMYVFYFDNDAQCWGSEIIDEKDKCWGTRVDNIVYNSDYVACVDASGNIHYANKDKSSVISTWNQSLRRAISRLYEKDGYFVFLEGTYHGTNNKYCKDVVLTYTKDFQTWHSNNIYHELGLDETKTWYTPRFLIVNGEIFLEVSYYTTSITSYSIEEYYMFNKFSLSDAVKYDTADKRGIIKRMLSSANVEYICGEYIFFDSDNRFYKGSNWKSFNKVSDYNYTNHTSHFSSKVDGIDIFYSRSYGNIYILPLSHVVLPNLTSATGEYFIKVKD